MCRNCGALVGAGETACMMCGESVLPPVAAQTEGAREAHMQAADPETRRFVRAIITRPAPFTLVFLVACVFLFLLMKASGVDQNPTGVLDAYGAKINSRIDEGEWWRFVTPIFLHGGPTIGWIHLLINMYGLFILGPYVEKLYGSARFVFFWVATGIGGTLGSYLTLRPDAGQSRWEQFLFRTIDVPSVGASGALFGLVGVLFVFGIKFRRELPEGFKRAFGTGMLPMIAINIFIGFTVPIIDNAAHLGGLFTGALLALFINYKRPGERGSVEHAWHGLQFVALALVVVSFGMVAQNFRVARPPLPNANAESPSPEVLKNVEPYTEALNGGQEAFFKGLKEGDAEAVARAVERLNDAPPLDGQADALRDELKAILVREQALMADVPQNDAARTMRDLSARKLLDDFKEWETRFDDWVKTEGSRFGLYLKEPSPEGEAKEN